MEGGSYEAEHGNRTIFLMKFGKIVYSLPEVGIQEHCRSMCAEYQVLRMCVVYGVYEFQEQCILFLFSLFKCILCNSLKHVKR